jgi:pimeloyl-ACP methyl ester carboxylesterase
LTDFEEHRVGASICVVAFASGGGEFSGGIPHFEFGRFLDSLGIDYVLLRDSTDLTYQYGVTGLGDRKAVCAYLQAIAPQYNRLILMGLSVGALGALMYAQLARVGEVIVLSPFTSLGDNTAHVFGPGFQPLTDEPLHIDLAPLYAGGPSQPIRAFLSDGDGTTEDRAMAERVGIRDLTLVPGAPHAGLGKLMRDNGMLRALILGEAA